MSTEPSAVIAPGANDPKRFLNRPQWADMQGLVLSAYPRLDRAVYLFYAVDRPSLTKWWLDGIRDRVTSAFKNTPTRYRRSGRPRCNVNIGFTASGLRKLAGSIAHFGDAFSEGIDGQAHRSRLLGDIERNAPEGWRWGGAGHRVDVLLMLFAETSEALEEEMAELLPPAADAMHEVARVTATALRDMNQHEHFGFKDGISQPILKGTTDAERFPESIHITAVGEFVLGYADSSGRAVGVEDATGRTVPFPAAGRIADFGRNGTYLVARHLQQYVDRFQSAMLERTRIDGRDDVEAATRLASKIIGRWPDGTPLVPYANEYDNEFLFSEDPYGQGCPIGAHIRRANPRDTFDNHALSPEPRNNRRLLRRGRSYGPRPGARPDEERGLLFLCLNASIERQFEFIQQNWINNPAFAGLQDEEDPLVGSTYRRALRGGTVTIGSVPAPVCVRGLPDFVTVKGGEYFFLPGLTALAGLAGHADR